MKDILTKEQLQILLQESLLYRGGRTKDGVPINKYAFLTRQEQKHISFLKTFTTTQNIKVIVRVIAD